MKKTLPELRAQINLERKIVDKKPFSHDIIGICLRQIYEDFGKEEGNKTVREFGLHMFGWREQE
jgi:hypothetical protein